MTRYRLTPSAFANRFAHTAKIVACALGAATLSQALPACAQPPATAPAASVAVASQTPAEHWAKELAAFEASDKKALPPQNAVLFTGSSSIVRWKTLATDFPGVSTLNRGFGGSTITDSVALAPRLVWPYRPRAVVFYAGDNDLAGNKTPAEVFAAFQAFVGVVREKYPTIPIAFISIKPSPARERLVAQAQEANTLIAKWMLDGHDPNLTYIDVWTAMTTPQNRPRTELFGPDKLHMNSTGYELWTKIVTPYIKKFK